MGIEVHWRLLNFSVNTDFNFCGIEKALGEFGNVSIFRIDDVQQLSNIKIYGFKTDMTHDLDSHVYAFISCIEIGTCRLYDRLKTTFTGGLPKIVLGNVKVKSPVEDFQVEIFDRLSHLPYQTIVVPRHPISDEEMRLVSLPKNIEFRNTMGELESLQASANLTIMGRIFSADGLKPDDDHNPLEATISSHALCGIIKDVPATYEWLYKDSGLIHQCQSYEEVFSSIDGLIFDPDLSFKLKLRDQWILENRAKYLKEVEKTLEL